MRLSHQERERKIGIKMDGENVAMLKIVFNAEKEENKPFWGDGRSLLHILVIFDSCVHDGII